MHLNNALIVTNQPYAELDDYYLLEFTAPEQATTARPGQFVHVRCGSSNDPLLRRPISICAVDHRRNLVKLLYKVVGRGTSLLAEKQPGSILDVMGPLGNGFKLADKNEKVLIVAGGIGVAPLYYLTQQLLAKGAKPELLLGARTAQELLLVPEFKRLGLPIQVATDDGSTGYHGPVTGLMSKAVSTIKQVYTCGPVPMMKAVVELANQHKIPVQVSLEERMGCGVGACLACVCRVKTAGGTGYKRVCVDGPVFNAQEVQWYEEA